ncbi:hypothetical protein SAMN05216302_10724 [Nitrosomonas aestuarii]|uniref:Uncharacterized protein n=1 Tax=Nitrosomonas aestuarii TaxID=52441 RepID=A0A1I4H7X4_9PROT|nr:hypothetical protein [Nitrosomonas aestuarii]SFL37763.1 hypothetical protein SAMN05216302_10724 [Nitrosomonas aestuarii]
MIKNFIYLDVDKMNSLSSQIFEGITEYILREWNTESEETESQKGPIGSGKILGDILKQSDIKSEKRFLNDYSYTLLENKLIDDGRVTEFSEMITDVSSLEYLKVGSFVKVKGKAIFNDIKSIQNNLKNFNQIGQALAYVTKFQDIKNAKEKLNHAKESTKDKKQKLILENEIKKISNIDNLAQEMGLHKDQKFLDDLSLLLNYGYQDQFEIQIKLQNLIISANLKRECLREKEDLIIRKYSRQTEAYFVLFGFITQYKNSDNFENSEENNASNIKQALRNFFTKLTNLESLLSVVLIMK